jgi:hypothetical protein
MPADAPSAEARRRAAREVIDILHEIATLLVHLPLPNLSNQRRNLTPTTEHPPRPPTTILLRLADRKRREPGSPCCTLTLPLSLFCVMWHSLMLWRAPCFVVKADFYVQHSLNILCTDCAAESHTAAARRIPLVLRRQRRRRCECRCALRPGVRNIVFTASGS